MNSLSGAGLVSRSPRAVGAGEGLEQHIRKDNHVLAHSALSAR